MFGVKESNLWLSAAWAWLLIGGVLEYQTIVSEFTNRTTSLLPLIGGIVYAAGAVGFFIIALEHDEAERKSN